jgi:hypothetical protein
MSLPQLTHLPPVRGFRSHSQHPPEMRSQGRLKGFRKSPVFPGEFANSPGFPRFVCSIRYAAMALDRLRGAHTKACSNLCAHQKLILPMEHGWNIDRLVRNIAWDARSQGDRHLRPQGLSEPERRFLDDRAAACRDSAWIVGTSRLRRFARTVGGAAFTRPCLRRSPESAMPRLPFSLAHRALVLLGVRGGTEPNIVCRSFGEPRPSKGLPGSKQRSTPDDAGTTQSIGALRRRSRPESRPGAETRARRRQRSEIQLTCRWSSPEQRWRHYGHSVVTREGRHRGLGTNASSATAWSLSMASTGC